MADPNDTTNQQPGDEHPYIAAILNPDGTWSPMPIDPVPVPIEWRWIAELKARVASLEQRLSVFEKGGAS